MIKKLQLWIEGIPWLSTGARFVYMQTVRRYTDYRRNRVFQAEALVALHALQSVYHEIGAPYWLEFGTMLGAVREKGFISHDLDIDIGMFADDYRVEHEKIFEKYGFRRTCTYVVDEGDFAREETYYHGGVGVDIFYFHLRTQEIYCHTFAPIDGKSEEKTIEELGGLKVRELRYPYAGFETIDFMGMPFTIPANIDEHLKESYGENWRIKDPNYSNAIATNVAIIENKIGKRYLS